MTNPPTSYTTSWDTTQPLAAKQAAHLAGLRAAVGLL